MDAGGWSRCAGDTQHTANTCRPFLPPQPTTTPVAAISTHIQDPALEEATASEPLTLQQEYEMQQSWAQDEDKATFIVLDRSRPDTPGTGSHGGAMAGVLLRGVSVGVEQTVSTCLYWPTHSQPTQQLRLHPLALLLTPLRSPLPADPPPPPAGDVNLFFNDHDDRSIAEIEIMIAEPSSRRQGIATEALTLFQAYGVSALGVTKFRAKIGEDNSSSLELFQKKMGYREVSRSAVFKEVTLESAVEGEAAERLQAAAKQLRLGVYDDDAV